MIIDWTLSPILFEEAGGSFTQFPNPTKFARGIFNNTFFSFRKYFFIVCFQVKYTVNSGKANWQVSRFLQVITWRKEILIRCKKRKLPYTQRYEINLKLTFCYQVRLPSAQFHLPLNSSLLRRFRMSHIGMHKTLDG